MMQTTRLKTLGLLLAGLTTLAAGSGCLQDKKPEESAGTGTPAPAPGTKTATGNAGSKKFVVGFAQANSKDPWRQAQNASLKAAASTYPDIELEQQDAVNDSQTQIGQVETFLTKKINLLLISPNESTPLTSVVGKVYDASIPVVLMDRSIDSDKYTTLLGGDNMDIGRQAGAYIAEKSGGTGNIVEIYGLAKATPTKERHDGFAEAIAKTPGLKVVDHQVCDYEREKARSYMENVLQKRVDFRIIYAHNDEMALGAIAALKAAGKDPKQYIIVGIDGVQPEAVNAIKAGEMSATFKYPWLGKEAIDTAHAILMGGKVEKRITLPTERVTSDNADAYLAQLPK